MLPKNDPKTPSKEALVSQFMELVTGNWKTQALCVAARLNLADYLSEGPRSWQTLSRLTQSHAPSLHRLLRALTTIGILVELDDGQFQLTELGYCLCSRREGSLHSFTIYWGEYLWEEWSHLFFSIKTGESARPLVSHAKGFDRFKTDAVLAKIFNRAMAELTSFICEQVVTAYDFSSISKVVVDVGGGSGELLVAILQKYGHLEGILVELHHVIEDARQCILSAGVADRCRLMPGDFFRSLPGTGDLYLFKSVFHDWDDEACMRILAICRKVMTKQAKLLLIERVMPECLEMSSSDRSMARTDLHMLIAHAARERTRVDFQKLLSASGFRLSRIISIGFSLSMVEAVPD